MRGGKALHMGDAEAEVQDGVTPTRHASRAEMEALSIQPNSRFRHSPMRAYVRRPFVLSEIDLARAPSGAIFGQQGRLRPQQLRVAPRPFEPPLNRSPTLAPLCSLYVLVALLQRIRKRARQPQSAHVRFSAIKPRELSRSPREFPSSLLRIEAEP